MKYYVSDPPPPFPTRLRSSHPRTSPKFLNNSGRRVCGLGAAVAPGPPLPSCPPREFFTFTTCRGTEVSGGGGGGRKRGLNHYCVPLCNFIPSQQHQSNLSGLECRLKSSFNERTCVGPQGKKCTVFIKKKHATDADPLPSLLVVTVVAELQSGEFIATSQPRSTLPQVRQACVGAALCWLKAAMTPNINQLVAKAAENWNNAEMAF